MTSLVLDENVAVHVIEFKRDRTPRDLTAQTLDYGSLVATLGRAAVIKIFANYRPGIALEGAVMRGRTIAVIPDALI